MESFQHQTCHTPGDPRAVGRRRLLLLRRGGGERKAGGNIPSPLAFADNQLPFVGFTFSKDYSPLAILDTMKNVSNSIEEQYDRNQNNISQVAELEKQLQHEISSCNEMQQHNRTWEAEVRGLKQKGTKMYKRT